MTAEANTSWTEWDTFTSSKKAREASRTRGMGYIRFGRHYAVPKTKRLTHVVVHFPGGASEPI